MSIPAYPLQWPAGWNRTPGHARGSARFKHLETVTHRRTDGSTWTSKNPRPLSIAMAVERVRAELERMGIRDDDLVISSNLQLRLDGLPRSAQREPDDPGICIYWSAARGAEPRCMAIDRYDRVADNLAAAAAALESLRTLDRHGAEILDRAFTGFNALPAPEGRRWWVVLGVSADARPAEIKAAYQRRRSDTHPDRGGDAGEFDAVQRAYEEAVR